MTMPTKTTTQLYNSSFSATPLQANCMNTHTSAKTIFVPPADTKLLPRAEAPILPTPPCVRRTLPFDVGTGFAVAINSAASIPRGRWDSARAAARELFIGLIPSRPAATLKPIQLELHFA